MSRVTFGAFVICGSSDNDLVRALPGSAVHRVDTPGEALDRGADGSAVLVLANQYPSKQTALPTDFYDRAKAKNLRLFVEYPSAVPGVEMQPPRGTTWERGVVASDVFGDALPRLRIVQPHDCRFVPVKTSERADLVIARVAGYDTAVYGIPPKDRWPLLFETNNGRWLVATTKLSQFVTARYAPSADWLVIWQTILHQLDPDHAAPELKVTPVVAPAYARDAALPKDVERLTLDRAANFYLHARLLITPGRQPVIHAMLRGSTEDCDVPATDDEGDGSLGMIEGFGSRIRFDGAQSQRTPIRSDCNAEAAMVLALASDAHANHLASNLLDYVFGPEMESMGRSDPKHPAFGLIAWGAISPAWMIGNYGDDDARVILSTIFASAAMKSHRWDEPLLRALHANLRTTGTLGFRGDRVDIGPLEQSGWKHFHDAATVNPAPHFESYLWACYLWAYARTGEPEFLEKTTTAIRMTMDAYAKQQWRWMDNIERSRMLLCLSWLVRLQDTAEHREWLATIARDLLRCQQPCGAIREERGAAGSAGGHYQIAQSNEAYGTGETPLIQRVGDPASDQLYTTGFALLGLHEAATATGDAELKKAEDRLAEFLCRIQIRSERLPYLDGGWFRAFDDKRWDYFASSGDVGWGAWCVEAGWGQAWTAAVLALRDRHTTLWDVTANSRIMEKLPKVQADMTQNDGAPLNH